MTEHSLTAAAINSTVLCFLTFMPTPAQIVKDEPDDHIRVNEASAAVVSVGLGIMLSFLARSGAPMVAAMVGAAAMVAGYEYLARTTDNRLARERNERVSNVRI